ncbi:unnamed protein product, partial [Prorocentrum cordatum]
ASGADGVAAAAKRRGSDGRHGEWFDPEAVGRGREPARATFFAFESRGLALSGAAPSDSARFAGLGGRWRFVWASSLAGLPPGAHRPDFDDSAWGYMPVPGNWELNGKGFAIYVNVQYPFDPTLRSSSTREKTRTTIPRGCTATLSRPQNLGSRVATRSFCTSGR